MNFSNPTPRQAALELIFAGALWGFGFVAAQWALTTWSPAGVLLWRFIGALALGELLYFLIYLRKKEKISWKEDFKGAIPAGLLLGTFLLWQTIGLQYTTASKSGFITTLYVVLVPVANWLFFGKKISARGLFLVAVAFLGTFLLMDLHPQSMTEDLNLGDLWTLASAFLGAAHIIYIGRFSTRVKNAFRANNFQSFWGLVVVAPIALWNPSLQIGAISSKAILGIFTLAAACSVLAFYIQVRAQKVLSDTTASMLFLLESPYAYFFAFLILGDRLNVFQSLGALLILGAALAMVVLESGSTNKTQSE